MEASFNHEAHVCTFDVALDPKHGAKYDISLDCHRPSLFTLSSLVESMKRVHSSNTFQCLCMLFAQYPICIEVASLNPYVNCAQAISAVTVLCQPNPRVQRHSGTF